MGIHRGADGLIGSRLRSWRKTIPLKSYQLADKIKITSSSLSEIELNKSLPSADTLAKLSKETNLNLEWLLTGQGKMCQEKTDDDDEDVNNAEFNKLIKSLKRIVKFGDEKKVELLKGFIIGADPGE